MITHPGGDPSTAHGCVFLRSSEEVHRNHHAVMCCGLLYYVALCGVVPCCGVVSFSFDALQSAVLCCADFVLCRAVVRKQDKVNLMGPVIDCFGKGTIP